MTSYLFRCKVPRRATSHIKVYHNFYKMLLEAKKGQKTKVKSQRRLKNQAKSKHKICQDSVVSVYIASVFFCNIKKSYRGIMSHISPEDTTTQRCHQDRENPYSMVTRDCIQNATISPKCLWLIIYLLSMKNGWKINFRQILDHTKSFMGKTNSTKS